MSEEQNQELTPEDIELLKKLGLINEEDKLDNTGFPEPPSKEGIVKFFRDILKLEDNESINRSGNLREEELGGLPLNVRTYNNLARYAEAEGMTEVADYLKKKSQITINTSLSRKAKLLELFVTQKKVSRTMGSPKRQVKQGLFGNKVITEEGVEET